MSFFGSHDECHKWGTEATKVIDGEMTSSPIRDGGTEAGGAPMGGTTEFTQMRTRTGIHNTQKSVRRTYGLSHDAKAK